MEIGILRTQVERYTSKHCGSREEEFGSWEKVKQSLDKRVLR